MIRDVFSQPHQAMIMLFFGLTGGLLYELVRLPRLRAGRFGTVFYDLLALFLLQVCLLSGLAILLYVKKRAPKKKVYFKPIHFLLLLAVDAVILAGVIIPQRTNRENAQLLLEEKQNELNAIKVEYEREQANLEYMQTDEYKLQQGSVRYGWHYTDDAIILDDDNESLAGGGQ